MRRSSAEAAERLAKAQELLAERGHVGLALLDDLRGRACDEVRVLEALGEPGEVLVGLADLALEARAPWRDR